MTKISYIIPHYGRDAVLNWHLRELNRQSFNDFEAIVVVDGPEEKSEIRSEGYEYPLRVLYLGSKRGPAAARNLGVLEATSDIVLFVGDDCIPHPDLIAQHYWKHKTRLPAIVQGYTPWHPDVVSGVTNLIDLSGLQANWGALRQDDQWVDFTPATFCLTTNYSIEKRVFQNLGGFNESFTGAAWEDVEFGFRAGKFGLQLSVEPQAINRHYHRYTLDSFLDRSRMEGRHRLTICNISPEFSWSMMSPETLRLAENASAAEIHKKIAVATNEFIPDEIKVQEFSNANRIMSSKGVLDRLSEEPYGYSLYKYARTPHDAIEIISGLHAVSTGHHSYAVHCAEWLVTQNPEEWYSYAFAGEIFIGVGDPMQARKMYESALSLNNGSEELIQKIEGIDEHSLHS